MSDTVRLYPLWKEAVKNFVEGEMFEPGTVISEEWKLSQFGMVKPESATFEDIQKFSLKLMSAFESFREELLTEYQIHLKPIGKGAHIVLAPNEQTKDAWDNGVSELRRTMQKMKQRLSHVQVEKLTSSERRENTDALARMSMLTGMFRKVRRLEIE